MLFHLQVHFFKLGRVLRPVQGAWGIRLILSTLGSSLPALFSLALVLFNFIFIFAVFGMSLFKHVKHRYGFDDLFNFQTFPRTATLLFQVRIEASFVQ